MKKLLMVLALSIVAMVGSAVNVAAASLDRDPNNSQTQNCKDKGGTANDFGSGGKSKFYCYSMRSSKNTGNFYTECTENGGVVAKVGNEYICDVGWGKKSDSSGSGSSGSTTGSSGTTWGEYSELENDGCVETSILGTDGKACVGDNGQGIFSILTIVLNVMTVGVGILAIIGFVITGIQYLTARDNEAQVAKAKQRMLQIVIGLFVFATMWAILNWILPGGVFGDGGNTPNYPTE